jgi:ribosomal protein S18 acetylase RimI-like enzyme
MVVATRETAVLRPLMADELPLVEAHLGFGTPGKHRARLAAQDDGAVVYAIAWLGDRPVGHVLVKWGGTDLAPVRALVTDCPEIENLFVAPDLRGRGVGTQLLEAAELLVRNSGYDRIGLDVATDNHRARALYDRHGFRDVGVAPFVVSGSRGSETCVYMVKTFASGEGRTGG